MMTVASTVDKYIIARAGKAIARLKKAAITVVTAESCTAGLIAAALARGEGASDVLQGGFITYMKEQKRRALRISKSFLKKEGSVTAMIAESMAKGALTHSQADVALSITGVLGPNCDEDGNPVGLVFICCAGRGKKPVTVRKSYGRQSHDQLRRKAVLDALKLLTTSVGRRG